MYWVLDIRHIDAFYHPKKLEYLVVGSQFNGQLGCKIKTKLVEKHIKEYKNTKFNRQCNNKRFLLVFFFLLSNAHTIICLPLK